MVPHISLKYDSLSLSLSLALSLSLSLRRHSQKDWFHVLSGNSSRNFPETARKLLVSGNPPGAPGAPVRNAASVTLGTDVVSADSWRGLLPLGPEAMLSATGVQISSNDMGVSIVMGETN